MSPMWTLARTPPTPMPSPAKGRTNWPQSSTARANRISSASAAPILPCRARSESGLRHLLVGVDDLGALRQPHFLAALDVRQRLVEIFAAVRVTDQERVQADRHHP